MSYIPGTEEEIETMIGLGFEWCNVSRAWIFKGGKGWVQFDQQDRDIWDERAGL